MTMFRNPKSLCLRVAQAILLIALGWSLSGCQILSDTASGDLPTRIPTAAPAALEQVAEPVIAPATPTVPPSRTPRPTPADTETPVVVLIETVATTATTVPVNPPVPREADPTIAVTTSTITATTASAQPAARTIGFSVQGRPLQAYQFGTGPRQIIFVGGIHGGYEWNSILLAYEVMDHFMANPGVIPESTSVHVIPSANPDGQFLITGRSGRFSVGDLAADTIPGRFNANTVDLNRNWDCEWSPTGIWRDQQVSAGPAPFSEPENIALRAFFLELQPAVVVFWHSAANGVFGAGCPDLHGPSIELAGVYGRAASYPLFEKFASYPISGDAGDWLTTQGIPSFTVELTTHESLDLAQNLAGVEALLAEIGAD